MFIKKTIMIMLTGSLKIVLTGRQQKRFVKPKAVILLFQMIQMKTHLFFQE